MQHNLTNKENCEILAPRNKKKKTFAIYITDLIGLYLTWIFFNKPYYGKFTDFFASIVPSA
jgi:hypothetical protein